MLDWLQQFSIFLFLDSNNYSSPYSSYECLMGAGVVDETCDSLDALQRYHDMHQDWLLGHICYDYKNTLEPKLTSGKPERMGFPQFQFFCPQIVCYIDTAKEVLTIESIDTQPQAIYDAIISSSSEIVNDIPAYTFTQAIDKDDYLQRIDTLRRHIGNGDCYEINFCNEGYCTDAVVEPLQIFHALNRLSPAPFAAYYRCNDSSMMCASPERYLQKDDDMIMAQPIKGTARRDADTTNDNAIKAALQQNIKERAENVMIVDLMRNDLARCCEVGSVQVNELFGVYTFPQVHQLISTVSGKMKNGSLLTDALRCSFPMGSMTGAPKVKVMELIERYEAARRELFSGTVGYITPGGDFDFNVIIRSLFYNAATQYLSYQTGGAITYDSNPQQEWEEMRLKAWALEQIFAG